MTTCDVLSSREAHLSLGVQGSYWGRDKQTACAWHISEFWTPGRREVSCRSQEVLPAWGLLTGQVPSPHKGQPCRQAFVRWSQALSDNSRLHREEPTCCYFFHTLLFE